MIHFSRRDKRYRSFDCDRDKDGSEGPAARDMNRPRYLDLDTIFENSDGLVEAKADEAGEIK